VTIRRAGLLLHPTSLPGPFGIGDLGPPADAFLDWAEAGGQALWQVLPLGPADYFGSPYDAHSAFAGSAFLISPEQLAADGLLPAAALDHVPSPEFFADDARAIEWRIDLLRRSWDHFRQQGSAEDREGFERFAHAEPQRAWLADWALYATLKATHGGRPWTHWSPELVRREPSALDGARAALGPQIEFQQYVQFLFFRQWERLRQEAHRRGILIMGDLSIYIALDSADVWVHRGLFTVDQDGQPEQVSGVPPDYFSATGQRWGTPLYRWDRMEASGYRWWIERLRANLRLTDLIRIDHFRGFAGYWAIPAAEPTAVHGTWLPGPGLKFFDALRAALGELPIVAEDLGVITQDVVELRRSIGCPGMKVLQFGFSDVDSVHLPHRYTPDTVVYTGTHDNDTSRGWFAHAPPEDRQRALDYLGSDGRQIEWDLIRSAHASVAEVAIVPVQDVLGLGSEARMNTPGQPSGNWRWRAIAGQFDSDPASRLRRLVALTGRRPGAEPAVPWHERGGTRPAEAGG
jgi:4-alpha-glucanotransferase